MFCFDRKLVLRDLVEDKKIKEIMNQYAIVKETEVLGLWESCYRCEGVLTKPNQVPRAFSFHSACFVCGEGGGGNPVAQLVEALRYRQEGRGFDSGWCHWIFSIT